MKEILLWKKLKTNREDQQEIAGLEVLQESQHFILRQPSFPKQQFLGRQSRTEFYQIRERGRGRVKRRDTRGWWRRQALPQQWYFKKHLPPNRWQRFFYLPLYWLSHTSMRNDKWYICVNHISILKKLPENSSNDNQSRVSYWNH